MDMDRKYIVSFKEAFAAMQHGLAVKRIGWLGYWRIEEYAHPDCIKHNGETVEGIVMHLKDGKVVRMNDGCDSVFTAENMSESDWMVLSETQKDELDKVIESGCLKWSDGFFGLT